MFKRIIKTIKAGEDVDPEQIRRWFDLAMTKKLGVLKTPSSFWSSDPKINPRADHLLWMALLLDDRERLEMAVSALAVEYQEHRRHHKAAPKFRQFLQEHSRGALELLPAEMRQQMAQKILRFQGETE